MTWRAAIVGLGNIGMEYDFDLKTDEVLTHAKAFHTHSAFELAAGMDSRASQRDRFTAKYARPSASSVDQLAKEGPFDVVTVAVPAVSHLATFEEVLALKPKLIVLEKPVALSASDAQAIMRLARTARVEVYVNYMRLADPAFAAFVRQIKAGEFGACFGACLLYTKGLFNTASHFISLLMAALGTPNSSELLRFDSRQEEIADFNVDFALKYGGFTFAGLAGKHGAYRLADMELFFEKQRFRITDSGRSIYCMPGESNSGEWKPFSVPSRMRQYQLSVCDRVAERLASGTIDHSNLEKACDVVAVCEEIIRRWNSPV